MTTRLLDCSVSIGGVDVSDYVTRIQRENFVCRPMGTATIYLDPENAPSCDPGDAVTISEMNHRVFTGYVSDAVKERAPAAYEVQCQDTLKRLVEYNFVDEALVSSGETVTYWIEYFLNTVGVSHSVASATEAIPSGIEFHLESVMDIVQKLCGTKGWHMYADEYGVVHIGDFFTLGAATTINNAVAVLDTSDDGWLRKLSA